MLSYERLKQLATLQPFKNSPLPWQWAEKPTRDAIGSYEYEEIVCDIRDSDGMGTLIAVTNEDGEFVTIIANNFERLVKTAIELYDQLAEEREDAIIQEIAQEERLAELNKQLDQCREQLARRVVRRPLLLREKNIK